MLSSSPFIFHIHDRFVLFYCCDVRCVREVRVYTWRYVSMHGASGDVGVWRNHVYKKTEDRDKTKFPKVYSLQYIYIYIYITGYQNPKAK